MTVKQLRAFLAVAQSLSFAQAGERLHLSQPALSLAIKSLEESLGGPLLERTTRSVSLTPEGETLLPPLPPSGDLRATMDCLRKMGAALTETAEGLRIRPICRTGESTVAPIRPDCGESGSTLRFLLPVAAAMGINAVFTGKGRLPQRPVRELLAAM